MARFWNFFWWSKIANYQWKWVRPASTIYFCLTRLKDTVGEHLGSRLRGSIIKSGWGCVAWEWRWTMPSYWWSKIIGGLRFHSWWQCRLWRTGVWIQGTTGDSHYSAPFWLRHNLALRSYTLLNRMLAVGRVFDTLSYSIQCLNFAKKWFIQYLIQYCLTQDSIQNIIQFKKILLIQFKR